MNTTRQTLIAAVAGIAGLLHDTERDRTDVDDDVYPVQVRDAKGVRWRVDLNAGNGAILDQKRAD